MVAGEVLEISGGFGDGERDGVAVGVVELVDVWGGRGLTDMAGEREEVLESE